MKSKSVLTHAVGILVGIFVGFLIGLSTVDCDDKIEVLFERKRQDSLDQVQPPSIYPLDFPEVNSTE